MGEWSRGGCASSPPSIDPAECMKPLTYEMSIPCSCRPSPTTGADVDCRCSSSPFPPPASPSPASTGGSFCLTALTMAISAWNAGMGTTPR